MRAATARAAIRRGCVWPMRPRYAAAGREADLGQLRRLARTRLAADDDHRVLADGTRNLVCTLRDRQVRRKGNGRLARGARLASGNRTRRVLAQARRFGVGCARCPGTVDAAGKTRGVRAMASGNRASSEPRSVLRSEAAVGAIGGLSLSLASVSLARALRSGGPFDAFPGIPCRLPATRGLRPRWQPPCRNRAWRRRHGRRCRHAALGGPRRHADDRPAFAEREPDQQHQSARLRISARPRQEAGTGTGTRRILDAGQSDHVALQAAARRQISRWRAVHRRRCRVQLRARARRFVAAARVCQCVGHPEEDRRPHCRVHHQRAQPDRARAYRDDQHHEQGMVREESRHQAAELHAERGDDHRAPGQRHRPLFAEGARARCQDRARQESRTGGGSRRGCGKATRTR